MGASGRVPGWVGFRFGHRAALQPAREHLDRLGEGVHPGLEPTQPVNRGLRSGIWLWLPHKRQAAPGPMRAGRAFGHTAGTTSPGVEALPAPSP
jgi:hypothetical protein